MFVDPVPCFRHHEDCFWINGFEVPPSGLPSEPLLLTTLCGHGHFDLTAYDAYNSGRMKDEELSLDSLKASLAKVPVVQP